MNLKSIYFRFKYLCISCIILISNVIYAQSFERIETIAGFGVLEENNGVAVADYDGDLDLDVFVVAKGKEKIGREKSYSKLFRNNNNGSFTDVTVEAGLVNLFIGDEDVIESNGVDGFKMNVSWGDFNNDGFPDIFFTYVNKIQLFQNLGDGTFTEVTEAVGINSENGCFNTGATWVDYNNDSFLDVFICNWGNCNGNILYKNNGNGTFQNVSELISLADTTIASFAMLPFDVNNDGWLDFYVTNDFTKPNSLFINQNGGGFREQAADFGLDSKMDDMGISRSDFDNDGDFDLFITGISENALLENDGSNHFFENSNQYNITETGWGWGNTFADFDLDGDEDLFIVNGFKLGLPEQNAYFKNLFVEGDKGFLNNTNQLGFSEMTRSVEPLDFDYDNDGDLDLFVSNADQNSFFYENKIISANEFSELNWVKISLQGTISNRDAIGATVSVTTNKGTYTKYYSGVGYLSQSLKPVHFGLNTASTVDELKIIWPSGLIEKYNNIDVNVTIKAIEGNGIEILNMEPSVKIKGCIDPNSCNYNPLATFSDNSCQYLPSKNIIGPTISGFNKVDSYSYSLNENASAIWTVEGGHIVNGQGTSTIKVKWGVNELGTIKVLEKDSKCQSEVTSIDVALRVSEIPENVSIARIWNEALLEAIRKDFARPTVHARNLFHTSVVLYDSWAIYDSKAKPYLMGNTVNNFESTLNEFTPNENIDEARKKTMSFAAYRLLVHRFKDSPGAEQSLARFELIMNQLDYNTSDTSVNYESGNAAALGNYIAETMINYGALDGSNEANDYQNTFYETVNPPINLSLRNEETGLENPNRWQPLSFNTFIDQSGNLIPGATPSFLSPEWGKVLPFALSENDKNIFNRDGNAFEVYHNPESPPQLNLNSANNSSDLYKWNFSLVGIWSSHLDPSDGVIWDISPKTIGNIDINLIPKSYSNYASFYNEFEGGDISKGHNLNPSTQKAYKEQLVPRADYARVLAEFWADGPDSETPPGHWFTILNYVSDHDSFERKFNGKGDMLSPLEWDVKSYFILSGAMHDAAVTAWGIKGWHDYLRPISAIRYMCELGQSSNPSLDNYHVAGIPLVDGFVEIIENGDDLSGTNNENVGRIKVYAWKGHDFINDSNTDVAGVGWILGQNWWPYQRPSFVTPPFAGFVSGHSTFSRAAAEVMTLITGDEFFPGGMGEFVAKKNDFLVFEKGPSVDVKLQWATYRDASDQSSLSRIWGGIHPPVDDLPGRLIGEKIGIEAYNFAIPYFNSIENITELSEIVVYPNPSVEGTVYVSNTTALDNFSLYDLNGKILSFSEISFNEIIGVTKLSLPNYITAGIYILKVTDKSKLIFVKK